MIVDRDLSDTPLWCLRGRDPVSMKGFEYPPMLLVGWMGVGKSEILRRFQAEQPHILYATVRSTVVYDRQDNSEKTEMPTDETINDIGIQFGLPDRSIAGAIVFVLRVHSEYHV